MTLSSTISLWLTIFLAVISSVAAGRTGCTHDQCLRAFIRRSSEASQFCGNFTVGPVLSTPAALASLCTGDITSRMSSACSCLSTTSATSTGKSSSVTHSSVHTIVSSTSIKSSISSPIHMPSSSTSTKPSTSFSIHSSTSTSTKSSSLKSSSTLSSLSSTSIKLSTSKYSSSTSSSVLSSSNTKSISSPSTKSSSLMSSTSKSVSSTTSIKTSTSTSSSAVTTSSIPTFAACLPTFTLSGVSENVFNPANQPFELLLSCSSLARSNYTVYANWYPIVGTTNTSSSISIPGQPIGYTLLTVLALDTSQNPILQSFQLLFGLSSMQVQVLDANGNPFPGASVQANATTYINVGQTAITDATGIVTLENVPPTTISLKATTADDQIAVDGVDGVTSPSVTMNLVPLTTPENGTAGFDVNNGTTGWTGGTVETISKRDNIVLKRDDGLVVFTDYSPDVQTAYKSFSLINTAQSVYIVYMFQTDEFPGGFFGTQYNDYYSITIRADDGNTTSVFHSMNELGAGAFDANGATQWYTIQMPVSSLASFVEFDVAVSNVADALYQSQVIVSNVGVCDQCATCTDCPSLARCQDVCLNPPLNSCAFYQACAEATLNCGPSGFPLAYGQQTCNKFQNSFDQFSAVGQTWFLNTEQCLQQALVPLLSCDGLCNAVQETGFNSIPGCYNYNDFCSLEGMDYVLILTTLKDDLYRNSLKQAVVLQQGCSKQIVATIVAAIQSKVADAAAGGNIVQDLSDAASLAIALIFYQTLNSNGALPDIPTSVKYIQQVYNTAVDYTIDDPNILAMDFLRYRAYNTLSWIGAVGTIPPAWIDFAAYEGLQFYDTYPDPGNPPIPVRLDHLYATMAGVYVNGANTLGDSTGWLGDLYTFYADWQRSGVASGSLYCQQNLGQQTGTTFPMTDLRQDADGYNSGMRLRNNPGSSMADEFVNTIQNGGYAARFTNFFQGRFGGSTATASSLCMGYMTDTISNPEAWYIRHSLTQQSSSKLGSVPFPENINTTTLQDFCDGFAGVLQAFAASE